MLSRLPANRKCWVVLPVDGLHLGGAGGVDPPQAAGEPVRLQEGLCLRQTEICVGSDTAQFAEVQLVPIDDLSGLVGCEVDDGGGHGVLRHLLAAIVQCECLGVDPVEWGCGGGNVFCLYAACQAGHDVGGEA